MDLSKLFEMQKTLDYRIIKEHGLIGKDLLPNLILSLQVELGELANEWQGFKHWKVNPQPKEHMLEEYVDCLHFILSIGNKKLIPYKIPYFNDLNNDKNIVGLFRELIVVSHKFDEDNLSNFVWISWFNGFVNLGEMLGFTWEQIEQAYMDKNKVNHERQDNGY